MDNLIRIQSLTHSVRGSLLSLDAGEFTDLKFDTLLERVRSMVKGPRPA